jgi:hypothetical protein
MKYASRCWSYYDTTQESTEHKRIPRWFRQMYGAPQDLFEKKSSTQKWSGRALQFIVRMNWILFYRSQGRFGDFPLGSTNTAERRYLRFTSPVDLRRVCLTYHPKPIRKDRLACMLRCTCKRFQESNLATGTLLGLPRIADNIVSACDYYENSSLSSLSDYEDDSR